MSYRLSNVIDLYFILTLQFEAENASAFPVHGQERFISELQSAADRLEQEFATVVFNYLVLACAGEARHATRVATGYIPDLEDVCSRSAACDKIISYNPEEALDRFVELFNEHSWDYSYGGPRWGHIAETALSYARGEVTRQFFIDHLVDLVHNGGFVFDKYEALELAGLDADISQDALNDFLTIKTFSKSLLEANLPDWVFSCLSRKTVRLVRKFYNLYRGGEVMMDPRFYRGTKPWPDLTVINWGNALLSEVEESDFFYCGRCDCLIKPDRDSVYEHNGRFFCEDCWNWTHTLCQNCKEWTDNDDIVNVDGEPWCYSCAESDATYCDWCSELTAGPVYTVTDDDGCEVTWCETCFQDAAQCAACGRYTHNYTISTNNYLVRYCDKCNKAADEAA